MLILTLRTDKPEAEIGLFEDSKNLVYIKWDAHRELAQTIHIKLEEALKQLEKKFNEIEGVAVYKGPGSFTGLRIGLSVANALAYSLHIAIIGVGGEEWINGSIEELVQGRDQKQVMPEYGALPHITKPRK
jgi:tRNA threonylcarbamoyladenosine biosynthesis protein TsaB